MGGWNGHRLSSTELFPSSGACDIPDLPQPRAGHTLSILSEGRLVVCGGKNDTTNQPTSDECISWVAGNTSWTLLYKMRCHPITFVFIFNYSVARASHTAWTPSSLPNSIVLMGGHTIPTQLTTERLPLVPGEQILMASTSSQVTAASHLNKVDTEHVGSTMEKK